MPCARIRLILRALTRVDLARAADFQVATKASSAVQAASAATSRVAAEEALEAVQAGVAAEAAGAAGGPGGGGLLEAVPVVGEVLPEAADEVAVAVEGGGPAVVAAEAGQNAALSAIAPGVPRIPSGPRCSLRRKIPR